jgi:ABC-type multidrug transport system fused ATPase/permease subunit
MASPTLELMAELQDSERCESEIHALRTDHEEFIPNIEITKLNYSYPFDQTPIISSLNLLVPEGSYMAIVGTSGVGKSTLVDLILGILTPTSGYVTISGMSPKEAITKWPGAIGYVPQEVAISDGTILENVLVGYPKDTLDSQSVYALLRTVELEKFVRGLEKELATLVGERGSKLSGGQRQRIGIARSLYTAPLLLVLDEATSSLDADTEELISGGLQNLSTDTTLVTIAHRLSTVRNADLVMYVENGSILATGVMLPVLPT